MAADEPVSAAAIKIPTNSAEKDQEAFPSSPKPVVPPAPSLHRGHKTSLVIDKTLSSTANLVKLLPSGTVLAFQALSPSFSNRGMCHISNRYLTAVLIYLCVFACVFLSFTDSLKGVDGKLYYGVATCRGFYVLNYEGRLGDDEEFRSKVSKDDLRRYRVRFLDLVHAFFGVTTFLTLAFSNADVQNCFFPRAGPNMRQLLMNLPLGAGFMSSLVFMIFPTTRKGIGYSDMGLHPDD